MCKLTNIMNKLNDSQYMSLYVGSKTLYTGKANKLSSSIDKRYLDIEIDSIETEIIKQEDNYYLSLKIYFFESKEL